MAVRKITKIFIATAVFMLLPLLAAQGTTDVEHLVCVLNYPFQIWNDAPTKIHVCLFKPDFSPAAGTNVAVDGVELGVSDEDGTCIFDYTPGNSVHKLTASLTQGGILYLVEKNFKCNARRSDEHVDRVYVYTDRAIYNPGQDILIRCIAWVFAGTYKPRDKARIKIVLQDKEKHIYSGGYVTTNEYGVGAFKIALPPNMKEGSYDLLVIYEKVAESTPIKVQRFVPPVIRIEHNLPRYLTHSQETLPVEVKLSFFAGGSMRKSQLELSVVKFGVVVFSLLPSEQKPGYYNFALDQKQLEQIRAGLTAEQPFEIKVTAKDEYGRTDTVTRDLLYTARPYSATLELDKQSYLAGETVQVVAKVTEQDRRPAVNIPLELYVGTPLNQKTDARGTATFTFVMGSTSINVQLSSPLVKSTLASIHVPLAAIPKPMTSQATMARGNVEAEIVACFDSEYVPVGKAVHIDLTDISGAMVVATTLPVSKEKDRYVAKGKITSPTWGTMLANLYCCAVKNDMTGALSEDKVGLITAGQKVTFHPDQKLFIVFDGLKMRVKPGEKIELQIRIDDRDDDEACLGVSLVDEAVISLGDPMEKKPCDYFYDPQLKTMASDGSSALTWPVLDRNWGQPASDIAYPNWGWKAPGKIHGKKIKYNLEKFDIEMVFVLDTMHRMTQFAEVSASIRSAIRTISSAQSTGQIKVGIVAYRCKEANFVTRLTDLSSNIDGFYATLANFQTQGLFPLEEADVYRALANAVDDMHWSSDERIIKMIYLIGATPVSRQNQESYSTICSRAQQKHIDIHTMSCLICGPGSSCSLCIDVERNWQKITELSHGRYTTLSSMSSRAFVSEVDMQLRDLGGKLEGTFIGYGKDVEKKLDWNMDAEGVIQKAKTMDTFFSEAGDLVIRYRDEPAIMAKLEDSQFPSQLRNLTLEKRKTYLDEKLRDREEIKNKILELERRRRWEMEEKVGGFSKDTDCEAFIVATVKEAAHKRGLDPGFGSE